MSDLKDSTEQPLLVKHLLSDPIVSENALKVLKERYLARDDQGNLIEDPKDMYIRVASAIAKVERTRELQEKWALKFYDIMATNRFLPNSPCLMNAGRRLGMLSACFVLPVQDNLEDIFSSVKATALVQRAGGGTGFNFSNLRPNGSIVKSSGGTTAGPLSFIDVFSQATSTIQQGAFRRGANMGILHIRHPDVVDFIRAKEDLKRWQNYNISVAMTDEFMEELELHPDNIHKVSHKEWGDGALYYRPFEQPHKPIAFKDRTSEDLASCGYLPWTVKDTWNLICTRAHNTGEPGLFFIDEANKNNPVAHLGKIEATNPCITGDTNILTVDGPVSIKELVDGNCIACNGTGTWGQDGHNGNDIGCNQCDATGREDKKLIQLFAWDPDSKLPVIRTGYNPRLTGYNSELLEVEFDSGLKVRCTKNHNFRTFRGEKIEAQALTVGQSVRAFSISKHRDGHLRAHGWVANKTVHQWVHRMVWEQANGEIPEGYVIHHKDGDPRNNKLENLELLSAYDHQSEHYETRKANGFSREGWKTPESEVNQKISDTLRAKNHKVVAIRDAGREDVYNITVSDVHTYIIVDPEYKGEGENGVWSGIVSCNCGEQPLHAYDSCNLGSINLAKYYSPTSSTKFDYVNFEKDIVTAVRFLDNVIDANRYPIPEIEKMSKATRRIGLGVMGFADLLFKLELGYNTIGALEKAERIGANFNASARKASADLAEEKGIAPALKALNCGKECFYRNAFRTTVAPTGTISIIANCSGGIEPLFALAFKRTVMPDANGKFKEMYEQNEHFTNALMSLNSEVDHLGLENYARQHGSIKNYSSPMSDGKARKLKEIFVTSHDIDPSDHVKMQIVWQSCVDTAISKTINLPHDAPVEVVSKVYWEAYYGNCKGITVYRDGCRNNVAGMKQPMSVEKTPEFSTGPDGVTPVYGPTKIALNAGNQIALKELVPVQREKKVTDVYPAFRTQIKTQYGNLHVCIVLDEDGKTEREIFAQLGKAGDIIAADLEAICRVASLSLRNGVSLEKVIDQLKDIGSTHVLPSAHGKIVSMPDALAKALQKYALRQREGSLGSKDVSWETSHTPNTKPSNKDTTESNYGIKCPACTVGTLSFQEGCQKCHSCGYSAC